MDVVWLGFVFSGTRLVAYVSRSEHSVINTITIKLAVQDSLLPATCVPCKYKYVRNIAGWAAGARVWK
jgi:hypothetical protein